MVNILRKIQQPVMILITIVIIVGFIWYWNGNQGGRGNTGGFANSKQLASIYGHGVTDVDVKRTYTKFQIAAALGMTELVQGLAGNAQDQQHAAENYIWNSYILDHEAEALQITPSDAEVQEEESRIPAFQTDGHFDQAKMGIFVQDRLPVLGFSDSVLDDLARQQVKVKKLMALVGSTVQITPAELKNRFAQQNEKLDISVARLSTSDVEKSITITDADAKKAYDADPSNFKSDEQRKITVASFELTDKEKDLTGKDRADALQKLGNDAWTFYQGLSDKTANFTALAQKANAKLTTTGFFTVNQPDPTFANVPAIGTNAFRLDTGAPNSDIIEGTNGYYVLHLEGTVPAKQLSYDDSKARIIAQLQRDRAAQLMQTKATESHDKIAAEIKAGKSFADAAKDAGLTAETVPTFTLETANKVDVPDAQQVLQTAITLQSGKLSDFVSTEAGGLFVHMDKRTAPEMASEVVGEAVMKDEFTKQQQMAAFMEWMRLRKDGARLQIYAQK